MLRASFVFTVFFMLLGPIKVIPAFFKLTHGTTRAFKREVAIKAALLASAVVAAVALLGTGMVAAYAISLDGLRLAGGVVLLMSALKIMFPAAEPPSTNSSAPTALQLAMSPVAVPLIVPPAGIAAILIFVGLAPKSPGIEVVIPLALVAMMALDFLVMFYIDQIVSIPGLLLVLQVFGAILMFIQVALAAETLMIAFRSLGVLGGTT